MLIAYTCYVVCTVLVTELILETSAAPLSTIRDNNHGLPTIPPVPLQLSTSTTQSPSATSSTMSISSATPTFVSVSVTASVTNSSTTTLPLSTSPTTSRPRSVAATHPSDPPGATHLSNTLVPESLANPLNTAHASNPSRTASLLHSPATVRQVAAPPLPAFTQTSPALKPSAPIRKPKPASIMRLKKPTARRHPSARVHNVTKPVRTAEEMNRLISWMEEYGYLSEAQSGAVENTAARYNAALRQLQQYAHIPVTGEPDDETMRLLDRPRCGERDRNPTGSRHKRYILLNRRWERGREIDVQFRNHTSDMSIDEQETIISYVVDQWNSAADARLVFHQDGDQIDFAEINIHHTRFGPRGRAFAPYGVLAYAALPRNGDMFFDDTERWAEFHRRRPISFSYKAVALHEMGHSLGLAHSNNPSAVMYAYYGATRHTLTADDIAGAVALFGAP